MPLYKRIQNWLEEKGVDFIHFVDITSLTVGQSQGFKTAILFGVALNPEYIKKVSTTRSYVRKMIENNEIEKDEFHVSELKTDRLADELAEYIEYQGFLAYSQSENNIDENELYDHQTKSTPLPHKTIAHMAGIGWIGKHNLLVNLTYGSALSMCSVLTNAQMATTNTSLLDSKCGTCTACVDICPANAITGNSWSMNTCRDDLVNVFECTPCIECMMVCPWTQSYMHNNL